MKKLGITPVEYCEIGNCNEDGERSHLITRGVLAKELHDDPRFYMIMCRRHHAEFHQIGVESFCERYGLEARLKKAQQKWAEFSL